MPAPKPLDLLFLNAPEDDDLRVALQKHLTPLERDALLRTFSEADVAPGDDAREEARRALDRADVIVVLVSADLLASDHHAQEMDRAIGRAALGHARVLPVMARPVDWEQTPFTDLRPVNREPLSSADDLDHELAAIASAIRRLAAPNPPNPRVAHRFAAPMW